MKFGDFVRIKRLEKRITQKRIASSAKMRQCELSFLENYNAPIPSEKKLVIIAQEIGISPDLLVFMAGKTPSRIKEWLLSNPEQNGIRCLELFQQLDNTQ